MAFVITFSLNIVSNKICSKKLSWVQNVQTQNASQEFEPVLDGWSTSPIKVICKQESTCSANLICNNSNFACLDTKYKIYYQRCENRIKCDNLVSSCMYLFGK